MTVTEYRYRTRHGAEWHIVNGVVFGAVGEVCAWIESRLGGTVVKTLAVAIGILREGIDPTRVTEDTIQTDLIAGAYFFHHQSDHDVSDICVAVAADDIAAARPQAIRAILRYPFEQLKVRRITAEIDLSNDRAVRQAQKLGFKLEGRKRRMGTGGGDVGVFGLLPDECPLWTEKAA